MYKPLNFCPWSLLIWPSLPKLPASSEDATLRQREVSSTSKPLLTKPWLPHHWAQEMTLEYKWTNFSYVLEKLWNTKIPFLYILLFRTWLKCVFKFCCCYFLKCVEWKKSCFVIRVQTVRYYDQSYERTAGISAWSVRRSPAVPLEGTGAKEAKLSEENCFPHT